MASVLLLNPRRRRKGRKTAARRRKNPRRHVARRRRNPRAHYRVHRRRNPSRRRHYARLRNPRRRYRRNPSFGSLTAGLMPTLKSASVGAAGGLANNLLYGYLNTSFGIVPAAVTGSPLLVALWQLAQALGLGFLAKSVAPAYARDLSVGAATVVLYNFAHSQLLAAVPSLPLSGMGAYLTMAPVVGTSSGMGRLGAQANGAYNPRTQGVAALRMNTYRPVGGLGRVGGMRGVGAYLGDANYTNGIPVQ